MIHARFWSTHLIINQIAAIFLAALFINLFVHSPTYSQSNALVADLSQSDISIIEDEEEFTVKFNVATESQPTEFGVINVYAPVSSYRVPFQLKG